MLACWTVGLCISNYNIVANFNMKKDEKHVDNQTQLTTLAQWYNHLLLLSQKLSIDLLR